MRLWSIHPKYLDPQGLVALWREALLAQSVLAGKTRGYRHHPQLERFKSLSDPLRAISQYLQAVAEEAVSRGYYFDTSKIRGPGAFRCPFLKVNRGQLIFEMRHLQAKLKKRSPHLWSSWPARRVPLPHPVFGVRAGGIEPWERL